MKSVFFTISLLMCMSCNIDYDVEDLHYTTKEYKTILHKIESVTDSIQLEVKRGENNSQVVSSTEYFKQEVVEIERIQQDCERALSEVFLPNGEIAGAAIGNLRGKTRRLQKKYTNLQHLYETLQIMNSMQ